MTGASSSAHATTRELLAAYSEASGDYWDDRHRSHDELASGGRIDLDHAGNEIFNVVRIGLLIDIIGDLASQTEPIFVLDAGCGKGTFARGLARCGHRIDAFDQSDVAIEFCRRSAGGPRYAVSTIAEWQSPWLYDVVLAVDVLFHIVSDQEWEVGLRNLASLVRLTGTLIVADGDVARRTPLSTYVVHRPVAAYRAVLEPLGLRHAIYRPYGFRDSFVGFHVFVRSC